MFPVALDLSTLPIVLIGSGEAYEKRRHQLLDAGSKHLVCHPCESRDLKSASVWLEIPHQVRDDVKIVMVAGLSHEESKMISEAARAAGKLVNVEDVNDLCDFYFMSLIQRGDLTIAVSTNGASPTVAKRVRDYIANRFGAEWAGFLDEMKTHRLSLRAEGKNMREVMQSSDALLAEKGWLDCRRCHPEFAEGSLQRSFDSLSLAQDDTL